MKSNKKLGSLFRKKPKQWGLRGDPFLWNELHAHFAHIPMPASTAELESTIERAFIELTGRAMSESVEFYIERYAHGGMSSGYICPQFWRDTVLPLLKSRLTEI